MLALVKMLAAAQPTRTALVQKAMKASCRATLTKAGRLQQLRYTCLFRDALRELWVLPEVSSRV